MNRLINEAPVLFLVFNRPQHTRESLERIRQAKPSRLYVHCDGARADRQEEAALVAEVRAIVTQGINWDCEVFWLLRDQNMGLREGVFGAINWFFEAEPYGIILEDDCVPDLSFFAFCANLLEYYRNDPQIMHIGGSNLAEAYTKTFPQSYVFTSFSFVWGWASWRRAWEKMSLDLVGLDDFDQSPGFRNFRVNRLSKVYMMDKFAVTRSRKNNSWAYAWFYSILRNNGLCIVPTVNLIQNTGIGAPGATNTTNRNEAARLHAGHITFPLIHPMDRALNPDLEQVFFYTSQKRRLRLVLWNILRKVMSYK